MKRVVLAALLLLSACGTSPDRTLPLPPAAAAGPFAPVTNAISGAAAAFANPAALAGRPAETAIAVERLEWLAEAVPRDPQFSNFSAITGPALRAARSEVRAALGIAREVPPPLVIAALDRAAAALASGEARSPRRPPLRQRVLGS